MSLYRVLSFATGLLAALQMPHSAAGWSILSSVDGLAGYNNVYHFAGKYILLSGQGQASFWSSDDGLVFTPHPNRYHAQGYNAAVFDDLMIIMAYGMVQTTTNGVNLVSNFESGLSDMVHSVVRLGGTYFAGTDSGLYQTTDPGGTWTLSAGNSTLPEPEFGGNKQVRFLFAGEGALVAALNGSAPYVSTDNGASFSLMAGVPAGAPNNNRVEWMGFDGQYLWTTLGGNRSLYRTTFESLQWELVQANSGMDLIAADPKGGIYAARHGAQTGRSDSFIAKSIDGLTWGEVFNYTSNNSGTSHRSLSFAGDKAFLGGTASRVFVTAWDDVIAPGEDIFRSSLDLGDGWRYSSYLGFYWAGSYPWIYGFQLGWTYVHGPNESGFYAWDPSFGWFFTGWPLYPYLHVFSNGEGYLVDLETAVPNTVFRRAADSSVVARADIGRLTINFNALAGKTIRFTDSIGTHTLVLNSFSNDADRGDLTMSIAGQTYTFSNVQMTFTETGTSILLQAQALVGDTLLGSTVQLGMHFTSAAGGTTNYVGYSLGLVPPIVTGGAGVTGTFSVE